MSELSSKNILISASLPPNIVDRSAEEILDSAIVDLCSALVREGATVIYGGNLDPNGFTEKIAKRLSAMAPIQRRPNFVHVIDEPSLVQAGYHRLNDTLTKRRSKVWTYACVGETFGRIFSNGNRIRFSSSSSSHIFYNNETFPSEVSGTGTKEAFSFARRFKIDISDACIAIGGKTGILNHPRDRYFGELPGLAEESIGMLEAGKPLIALGAYGGCAQAIAEALNFTDTSLEVQPERQPGFTTSMDILNELQDQVPDKVREELSVTAVSEVSQNLVDTISSIITRWSDHKPRGSNDSEPDSSFGR